MDRTELAWAAGFWDGEGWTNLVRHGRGAALRPMARVNQSGTHGVPEVLTRFREAVGVGAIQGPDMADGREPLYRWTVSSRTDVEATYTALRTWLGPVKRQQFESTLGVSEDHASPEVASEGEALAWAAGLFDGEGSTYLEKHGSHLGYFRLETAITQADISGTPFVLSQFLRVVGIGKIYGPYPAGEGWAPVYRWKAHRYEQIIRMLERLDPQLGTVKRQQAERAIAVIHTQVPLPRGNPAWGNRKTYCVNGHEYESARIRPFRSRGANDDAPRASKQCLVCLREYAREQRRRER